MNKSFTELPMVTFLSFDQQNLIMVKRCDKNRDTVSMIDLAISFILVFFYFYHSLMA